MLTAFAGRDDVIVLALPRGGVPVGFEVARALNAPLDVMIVRKLGVPGREELAMGAIASGPIVVRNDDVIDTLGIPPHVVAEVIARETRELERRERRYRGKRAFPVLAGKTVVLVDDGLATGASMLAAVTALRGRGPARIVAAVPVAAAETCALLERDADAVICARMPPSFRGVGAWYRDFHQTSDDEVVAFMQKTPR